MSRMTKHPFHLVDPSPWPLTGALGSFLILVGLVRLIHRYEQTLICFGLLITLLTITQWWRDVSREATLLGKHTGKVENGIRIGIILFIIREICLFFSLFWAFFHSSLSPNVDMGANWPPVRITPISPFEVPLLNTTVLLSRGATITWAHMAILASDWLEANIRIGITVMLGFLFTSLQGLEYVYSSFSIADSIYGSTFFLTTGFHGFHVAVGTFFIVRIWVRHELGHFSSTHHFGFEASAWYWHFVDVVWLFLFMRVYWWGY